MATFDAFYDSLDPDIRIRGKQFEKFVKWFLKTDPTWASQVDEVWLWNEYPKRWGADCGVDLIFTHKNGNTWAVQSKCISPNNDIKKSEIDSFLSESNDSKIDGRLLIASTDGIGKNAQQVIHRQEKQVVCFLLEQFRQSEIEFPSSIEDLNQGKRKSKKNPRTHQIEAIEKVSEGLKTADRGQVLMACGTGKTLTSLWIKERIKAEQVLVLVPSLSLLSQILKEWNKEANHPFKWICVCSDKSVARDKSEDQWISNTSEIGVPVTSETLEIKNFLDESGSKVVFATYQSAQLIVEAQEHHDTSDFDLVIADEAHRCAGRVSDAFGSVLDENKIKSFKRLFFTATPRILSKQIKTKSLDMDFEVASMDDHSVFGEIFYELKFSEAIQRDLLSDYQVVVVGVDDEMIKQKIVNRSLIKISDETISDAETIASQIAVTKAIKDYGLKRVITFHSRIKNAKDFATSFDQVISCIDKSDLPLEQINCEHISGAMKTSERNQKLFELKNLKVNELRILTNARCLSEGVDVPSLSGIAFINPKQSQIDIIQAVGRAIRKSHDKSKGTIVIPIYISENESLDEAILLSNFKKVWQIVLALKSQDDSLMECIDKLRIDKGFKRKINFNEENLEKFIFDIPEKISTKFSRSIQTFLIENSSEDWFEKYGELKYFFQKEGHTVVPQKDKKLGDWCSKQRQNKKKNTLSQEKIGLLEELNFVWDPVEKQWNESYKQLKKYFEKEKHTSISPKESPLGSWCSKQRQFKKKGALPQKKIGLLEELNFIWDPLENQWNESYKQLKKYFEKEGHSSIASRASTLGDWCRGQRQNYTNGSLSQKKIELLEELNFIWDPRAYQWNDSYEQIKEYFEKEGHSSVPRKHGSLGIWCVNQRLYFKKGRLSKEKIALLEELNFEWDPRANQWNSSYTQLKEYFEKEGHTSVPKNKGALFNWCHIQRQDYKKGKISKERIDLLEKLNFVWIMNEQQWRDGYKELEAYFQTNGHTLVPVKEGSLGIWVRTQRKDFKNGSLSQERKELLEKVQFKWKVRD
ncbi:hypothetical protein EU96_0210 [Prochlorococcus marinus str. MIT 9302]|uniref:Helicase n=1 Tax=Prochlorococcus marinus str. MIT 9302 TaxID=74545 RepID=A0A0A2ADH2_PROMR|nr:DEAD/DEAH box helicase [Prochlorococcus marinus]KGF98901.1 hypothetical protein EU96_0210 [Prochlorococcus marinus str. MIT 9302]